MILRVWDVTFSVTDLDKAADFYENVLGLSLKYRYSTYIGFDCGGVEIGLVPGTPISEQQGAPLVDFLVQDIEKVWRTLAEHGVQFLKEPHDTPWGGRIALFTDPDGNILQMVQIDWPKYFAACAT